MWVQSDGMEDGRWKMEDGRWKVEGGASTRRIVCNLPHPRGVPYERAHNNEQKINTAYAHWSMTLTDRERETYNRHKAKLAKYRRK